MMQILARKGKGEVFKAISSIGGLAKVEGQFLKLKQVETGYQRQRGRFLQLNQADSGYLCEGFCC